MLEGSGKSVILEQKYIWKQWSREPTNKGTHAGIAGEWARPYTGGKKDYSADSVGTLHCHMQKTQRVCALALHEELTPDE